MDFPPALFRHHSAEIKATREAFHIHATNLRWTISSELFSTWGPSRHVQQTQQLGDSVHEKTHTRARACTHTHTHTHTHKQHNKQHTTHMKVNVFLTTIRNIAWPRTATDVVTPRHIHEVQLWAAQSSCSATVVNVVVPRTIWESSIRHICPGLTLLSIRSRICVSKVLDATWSTFTVRIWIHKGLHDRVFLRSIVL